MKLEIKINSASGLLPQYETEGSSGMDLKAYIKRPVLLGPGERALIPTGISIELPEGYEAQIRSRSGLAIKHGVGLANGIGTIDSDYRGEIKIPLMNWGNDVFTIDNGDRLAQMIVTSYEKVKWKAVDELKDSQRGSGGFGHTGL